MCASFGSGGRWLSLGAAHAPHGFVELAGVPPLDESWRGRPDLVRRYRQMLADDAYAFLACEPQPAQHPLVQRGASRPGQLVHSRRYAGWLHRCTTRWSAGARTISQEHLFRGGRSH
ncbi:MAG: hypothetical protein M3N29_07805, partial [Chloroflexota bacterium]|nr:hypothetical protein [Chloroflexota bacterium]